MKKYKLNSMKKYKLKKWYPSLPKTFKEGMIVQKPKGFCETSYKPENPDEHSIMLINIYEVTDTEFWEEIIELCVPIGIKFKIINDTSTYTIKSIVDNTVSVTWENDHEASYPIASANDFFNEGSWIICKELNYEILSLEYNTYIFDRKDSEGKLWNDKRDTWLKEPEEDVNIYSIKRLYDDVIFTVGDLLDNGRIKSFKVIDDKLTFSCMECGCYTINDSPIEKAKKAFEGNFEVLSYKKGSEQFNLFPNGCYGSFDKSIGITLEEARYFNGYEIISVKYLTSGEIYTVKDRIIRFFSSSIDTIRGFSIVGSMLLVSISNKIDSEYYGEQGCNIGIIKHVPKALFTTDDGVEIFKGTHYFKVTKDLSIYSFVAEDNFLGESNSKYFCSRKEAEYYALENKVCLSYNDLKKNVPLAEIQIKLIKELIADKI